MSSATDAAAKPGRVPLGALKPLLPYALRLSRRIARRWSRSSSLRRRRSSCRFAVRRMIDFGFSEGQRGLIHVYFLAHDRGRRRARARLGVALLSRHDARRTGRRRSARRPLRASDAARPELLRSRKDRRDRLAPLRRHDAAQGDVRLLRLDRAAQSLHVRRRGRDDGRDQPETLGLCAAGDSRHRPAALRGGPGGAPALARARRTRSPTRPRSRPRACRRCGSCRRSSRRRSPPSRFRARRRRRL